MFGMFRKRTKASLTLEEKLAVLSGCGICLAPDFSVHHLLESWEREHYETPGYSSILVGLGMTEERPPWRHRCANLWHFDTECVEDEGSYVQVAARLAEMTQGALALHELQDEVDIEAGLARLDFKHAGKPIHLDLKVNDDWVDPAVFSLFVRLLAASDPSKVFLQYDLEGQDCILACVSREQYSALSKADINFRLLK